MSTTPGHAPHESLAVVFARAIAPVDQAAASCADASRAVVARSEALARTARSKSDPHLAAVRPPAAATRPDAPAADDDGPGELTGTYRALAESIEPAPK